MMRRWTNILLLIFFLLLSFSGYSQQRFPKPEFESGYEQPSPTTPEPRAAAMEYADAFVLLLVLSLAAWLVLKRRSRKGILWLSVFSLFYFGFYREGCICPIGAIQNVTLAFFDKNYSISLTVLLFFLLPLIFALFFGRVFCAGACPLGALQDLLIVKPVSAPRWINKTLGVIPYIYLSLAILFAATGTDFIICRYDPFVSFFRMNGTFLMIMLGIIFLMAGMFFARPYCRIFCPYGVLLGWMSRFSWKHLSITPAECIQCKLCAHSCPFEAIDIPTDEKERPALSTPANKRRLIISALLIPVWIFTGGFIGTKAHIYLSKANPKVYLAELMISKPEVKSDPDNLDVQAFLQSGQSMDELVADAKMIRSTFFTGSRIMGGFIGLVLGVMLMNQMIFRKKPDYEANKTNCFSCGRCMDYCPVGKEGVGG